MISIVSRETFGHKKTASRETYTVARGSRSVEHDGFSVAQNSEIWFYYFAFSFEAFPLSDIFSELRDAWVV